LKQTYYRFPLVFEDDAEKLHYHLEQREGPMQAARTTFAAGKVHRSFAAKNAAQDDKFG